MAKKLFVGNLSFDTTVNEVQAAFASCGDTTSVTLAIDRMTGRSRGFAFVEMATEEGAQRALEDMNGQALGGRPLRVTEAVDRVRSTTSRGTRGGGEDRAANGGRESRAARPARGPGGSRGRR